MNKQFRSLPYINTIKGKSGNLTTAPHDLLSNMLRNPRYFKFDEFFLYPLQEKHHPMLTGLCLDPVRYLNQKTLQAKSQLLRVTKN